MFRRLRARLKYRQFESDLARELEVHRAMKEDALKSEGVTPVEARSRAALALGNVTLTREDARSIWIARWFQELRQDVRYALAAFRRQPAFSLGVVTILGVGLGLVTTAHAVIDARYFRPWQVPNGSQVYFVRSTAGPGSGFGQMSFPELRYVQANVTTVEHLAATVRSGASVFDPDGSALKVSVLEVSGNYFDLLGVRMAAGRGFLPEEDNHTTHVPVAVISEQLWTERFQRDPAIIGRTVRIGRELHTIVGVAPRSFVDPHCCGRGVWRPLSVMLTATPEDAKAYTDPKHRTFSYAIITRLRDGVTPEQATAEISALSHRFRTAAGVPVSGHALRDTRPVSEGADTEIAWIVLGALVLIQLVACANVGNLVLARSIARQREMAVRLSLGAGQGRLVRQLVTEALVLSLCAAFLGVGLAFLIPSIVISRVPGFGLPATYYWPQANTFAVALALSFITALAAGLAPALRATRVQLSVITGERHGPTLSSTRLRRLLLATQVCLAAFLLSGAGILTRAITHASNGDPGFPIREFQQVTVEFPRGSLGPRRAALSEHVRTITQSGDWPPMTFVDTNPIDATPYVYSLRPSKDQPDFRVFRRGVSSNYFDVIDVPLLAGRMPAAGRTDEIVINQAAADRLWPETPALGRTVLSRDDGRTSSTLVIVGIAPDMPSVHVAQIEPIVYAPSHGYLTHVLVRSRDPRIGERFNDLVGRLDPGVTASARPAEDSIQDALVAARASQWVAWTIAGIGLLLATIGAFGVFAHAVEERRREIGIHLALGAASAQVVRLVVARTQGSVIVGVACGLVLAVVGAAFARGLLYGLSPFDPVAYAQVAAILTIAAGIATWIPVRRATRVNPAETLRAE
jgi:predicted permease